MLENKFKTGLVKDLKKRFPGCMVVHLDPNEIQGMPDFIKSWGRRGLLSDDGTSAYKHSMVAKNDIKIASPKAMADIYMKVTGLDKIDAGYYQRFMSDLANNENSEVQGFFKALRESGYNAIIDENDAQHYSKLPIILLDPKNDVITKGSHRISSLEKIMSVILM